MNTFFDNIYLLYINEKELYNSKKYLEKTNINVEYFLGFNGHTYPYNIPNNLKKGEFGHLNSFINILEDAKTKNYQNILILESDIYFCKNFNYMINKHENNLVNNKLVYLGGTQYKYYSEYTWDKIIFKEGYYRPYKTLGTFAVGINHSIFQELINLLKTYSKPTDVLFVEIQKKYFNESKVLYPNLICCNVTSSQTKINKTDIQVKYMNNLRWNLIDYAFINHYKLILNSGIYELKFNINSKLLNYLISEENEIFPVINNINMLNSIYNQSINRKRDQYNLFKIYINLNDETELYLKTENIFLNNIEINKINSSKLLKILNVEYLKNVNNYLTSYYSNLIKIISYK